MGMKITINDSEFQAKLGQFLQKAIDGKNKAIRNIASEVLRLSQFEVPHDLGTLQNSGFVQDGIDSSVVGYGGNAAPYAARLHEHPEYRFQKGRKGKYLEDPIKNNMTKFLQYYKDMIS